MQNNPNWAENIDVSILSSPGVRKSETFIKVTITPNRNAYASVKMSAIPIINYEILTFVAHFRITYC